MCLNFPFNFFIALKLLWNFCSTFNNFCTVETLWNHPNAPLLVKKFQAIPRTWQEVLWLERFQLNKYNKTNYIPSWIDNSHLTNIIKKLLCDEFWQNCDLKFWKKNFMMNFEKRTLWWTLWCGLILPKITIVSIFFLYFNLFPKRKST
jgi:hypothetical protein